MPEVKADLDTPCLIIDLDILEVNLQKMKDLAVKAGKSLRPHAKTHKCSTLAKKQMALFTEDEPKQIGLLIQMAYQIILRHQLFQK